MPISAAEAPEFSVLSPSNGAQAAADMIDVALDVPLAVDAIEGFDITVNGRRVASREGGTVKSGESARVRHFSVPLSGGANDIEIKGFNAIGQTVDKVTVLRPGARVSEGRGRLYVVAIGVDDYPNFKQNLKFAGADAHAFDEMLVAKGGPLHAEISNRVLAKGGDQPPTAANIKAALGTFPQCRA